jgi:UPF0755 protein
MLKRLQSYCKTIWTAFNRYYLWVPLAAFLVLAGCVTWYELQLRPTDGIRTQTFKITQGQSVKDIAGSLQSQGFVRNAYAFEVYVTIHGLRPRLQSGVYSPKDHAGAKEIATMIASGRVDAKRLTIPEGVNLKKIKELAAAQGIKTVDLDAALAAYRSTNASPVIAAIPGGIGLEGYLFPDTYSVSGDTPAKDLVLSMVSNMETHLADLKAGMAAQGLTEHQGLTLASVVEKEVSGEADRKIVAGIFLNRIKAGQPLQSDVTVIYAAEVMNRGFDLSLDSPYNTYKIPGLPIGPICSPGLTALQAVASPTYTDYHYFLAGKDGKTHYAVTFAEHQQNIAKYLN